MAVCPSDSTHDQSGGRGTERLPALPPSVSGAPANAGAEAIAGQPAPVGNAGAPGPQPTLAERVENSMIVWRNAIINKDAEPVERLDRTFAENPAVFLNALMSSAEGDPEPRVRAFSTRVLGKLHQPEAMTLLRRLLADKSEYVRFNAAWALGELGDAQAVAKLRVLAKRDPAPAVRQSAHQTLMKLGGT